MIISLLTFNEMAELVDPRRVPGYWSNSVEDKHISVLCFYLMEQRKSFLKKIRH